MEVPEHRAYNARVTKKVFLTVEHAARLLQMSREALLDLVKKGEIPSQYMQNTGGLGIDRDAILRHLKKNRNWQAIRASITPRLVVVDRDVKTYDLVRAQLRPFGVEVRMCTSAQDLADTLHNFRPDVIAVRLVGERMPRDTQLQMVIDSMVKSQRVAKVVVYHDLTGSEIAAKSDLNTQMRLVPAEFLINIRPGLRPLLEALKIELGIRD